MRLVAQTLDVTTDPFQLARTLAERPGVVLLWAAQGRVAYLASDPIACSTDLDPEPELIRRPASPYGEVPRWAGLIPYEACRESELSGADDPRPEPLVRAPLWLRYGAIARIERSVTVLGDQPGSVRDLCRRLRGAPQASRVDLRWAAPMEPEALHAERIRRALLHIARGDVYEVNLARRLEFRVRGAPWDVLAALSPNGIPWHAFTMRFEDLDVVAGSPELCLQLEANGRLLTRPIKGTRPRAADPALDAQLAAELDADPKERAELTMIIDVERNDLGRLAETGSVRLLQAPHVVTLPSVHHRQASIEARLRAGFDRAQVLRAMLPSGSVTGAPKRRAMQLIAELEPQRRGLYTGVVGFVQQDGGLELAMAIRTLVVRSQRGHFFTGGGIVADSDPAREVEETCWKAAPLLSLVAGCANSSENWED